MTNALKKIPQQYWIALIALLLYLPSVTHSFVYDDEIAIQKHEHVQNGWAGLPKIWTTNFLNGAYEFNDGLYRPIPMSIWAIQEALVPDSPFPGHLTNIVLYALICLLAFQVLQQFVPTSNQLWLFALGVLFVVHPLHTEVVANIKSLDELCSLFFALLLLKLVVNKITLQPVDYVFSALLLLGALLSKESAIGWVIVVPLLVWAKRQQWTNELTFLSVVFLAVGLGWYALHQYIIKSMPNPVDADLFSAMTNSTMKTDNWLDKKATGIWITTLYLLKMVFPYPLISDYSPDGIPVIAATSIKAFLGAAVLTALVVVGVRLSWKKTVLGVAILSWFVLIAPVSNIFMPIGVNLAERLAFAPTFVFVLAVGQLKLPDWQKLRIPAMVILGVGAVVTLFRIPDWKDKLTLFEADVQKLPESYKLHYNYATALNDRFDDETLPQGERNRALNKAIEHFNEALRIRPEHADTYNNLGNAYRRAENYEKSVEIYNALLTDKPNYWKGYYNRGVTLFSWGRYAEARKDLRLYAQNAQENRGAALYWAGVCSGHLTDFEGAINDLNQSLAINPNRWDAYNFLGMAYGNLNQWPKAVESFEKAYQLNSSPEIQRNLEQARGMVGK